ncbi:hypothetical protein BT69DRAFT_621935 [Atractiella rhizophila]|nr:hypothetical protein BT69DRAFT_621935 [Atractiella rhizophila]
MKSLNLRRSLNKDKISSPSNFQSTSPVYSSAAAPSLMSLPSGTPASPPAVGPYTPAGVLNGMMGKPNANPKRVIKAMRNYQARSPREPDGQGWFDASNPLSGARGLVPMSYFQILGRNLKENEMMAQKMNSAGGGMGQTVPPLASPPPQAQSFNSLPPPTNNKSQFPPYTSTSAPSIPAKTSGPQHQPLYGIVQYDFVAERADELDARKGEPLIIIAQSNHEWFVAKPIGRLGGPGLIPVAFVEIRDSVTGRKIERQDVEELMRSGGVLPKVEDWKKKAAEYRSRSIPLGKFEFEGTTPVSVGGVSGATPIPTASPLQTQSSVGPSPAQMYQQNASASTSRTSYTSQHSPVTTSFSQTSVASSSGGAPPPFPLLASATVDSFHQEEGSFWFHVRAKFEDGRNFLLYRLYEDFYDFQIALIDRFPYEAGNGEDIIDGKVYKSQRIIPRMPGPVENVDEEVCSQRAQDLEFYLNELVKLPDHVKKDIVFEEFLDLREGDVEMDQGPSLRKSPEDEGDGLMNFLEEMVNGKKSDKEESIRSLESGVQSMGLSSTDDHYDDNSRSQPMSPQSSAALLASPPTNNGRTSSWNSTSTSGAPTNSNASNPNIQQGYMKIKILHRNTDDLIAIRVPSNVTFPELLAKAKERLGNEVTKLSFKENEGVSANGRFIPLTNDRDLASWANRAAKMILYAD